MRLKYHISVLGYSVRGAQYDAVFADWVALFIEYVAVLEVDFYHIYHSDLVDIAGELSDQDISLLVNAYCFTCFFVCYPVQSVQADTVSGRLMVGTEVVKF